MRAFRLLPLIALSACAGAAEYTCPDPVGQIIRDDCQVYRTRYEALKVELGASLGPLGVRTAVGQSALRDVSELLQVFGHRMHALCNDFNACRVPPLEYRQRREAADQTFTTIAAIQGQLSQQGLDAQSRARLVEALLQALRGGGAAPPPAPGPAPRARARAARGSRYSGWIPWYGSKLLPPRPPARAGFPALTWVDVDLAVGLRRTGPNSSTSDGYSPSVTIALQGAIQPDDTVTVVWDGGHRTEEPISRRTQNGLAVHNARAPQHEVRLKGGSFGVEVLYRRGADGAQASLGRRRFAVASRVERSRDGERVDTTYGIDHDPDARQGLLIFRPVGDALPPDLERPSLFVVLKLRKYQRPTARCWVDGKSLGSAIEPGRGSGQEGTFQDRPRYRELSPGRSEGVAEPFVEWWHYDFPLPLVVPRAAGARPPQGSSVWPRAGAWRCVVSLEGEPVRELTFQVRPDGRLAPHPRQAEQGRAAWLVATRVIPSPVEQALGRFSAPEPAPGAPGAGASGPGDAAGPSTLRVDLQLSRRKGSLSPGQLQAALKGARPKLRACLEQAGTTGTVTVKAHVFPGGEAGANMDTERVDGWLRSCLSGALKGASFPRAGGYTYFDITLRASGHVPVARRGPLAIWGVSGGHTAAAILAGLGGALPRLRACASKNPQAYRLQLSVGTDGRVEVQDWARGYHPAVRGCIAHELKALRLPRAPRYTTLYLELRLGR